MSEVTVAVMPVAGLGSRFLPATKAVPKEMLPVVDKPLIAYAVEEAFESGIRDFVFVTSRHKKALEDHFDNHPELEQELERAGKSQLLDVLQQTRPRNATFTFVRQDKPLGTAHALLKAFPQVGSRPFAVLMPDELMVKQPGGRPGLAQLLTHFERTGFDTLGVCAVPASLAKNYGMVLPHPNASLAGDHFMVSRIVEKPKDPVPSSFASVGRYIFGAQFMSWLQAVKPSANGEYLMTDAIESKLNAGMGVQAVAMNVQRFDCGSKLGYLQANHVLGLAHAEVGAEFAKWLSSPHAAPTRRGPMA